MIVFKKYLKVLWHNKSIFFAFLIFLGFSTFFSLNAQRTPSISAEIKHYRFGIIDRSKSKLSEDLIRFLKTRSNYFPLPDDEAHIKDELFYRTIQVIYIIPENFETEFQNGKGKLQKLSVPHDWANFYLDLQINNYLNFRHHYEQSLPEASFSEISDMLQEDLSASTEVRAPLPDREMNIREGFISYFRFIGYVVLFQILSGIGICSVAFNKKLIYERIQCSSYDNRSFNRNILAGHLFLTFVSLSLPLLFSMIFFPLNMLFSRLGALLTLRVIIHTLSICAIAFLISTCCHTINSITMVTNAIGLPFCFFGGIFIPLEVMDPKILTFSRFLPQYWFSTGIKAISGISISTEQYQEFWKSIGIELIIAVAISFVAFGLSRQRRHLKI